ncbi:hypothetical protein ACOSP7_032701 [Xanthoceras sorbifolium]
MSAQDMDQAGYYFQKLMKIMGSIVTPPTGGDRGGSASLSKKTISHKRCANKGKEALPLPEPFSSEFSSQTSGSSQTKRSPTCSKRKHCRRRKPSSAARQRTTGKHNTSTRVIKVLASKIQRKSTAEPH